MLGNQVQLSLRLTQRNAVAQSSHHQVIVRTAVSELRVGGREQQEQVG